MTRFDVWGFRGARRLRLQRKRPSLGCSPRGGERPAPPGGHGPHWGHSQPRAAVSGSSRPSAIHPWEGGLLSSASSPWQGRAKSSPWGPGNRFSCKGLEEPAVQEDCAQAQAWWEASTIPSLLASGTSQYPNSGCAICNCLAGLASIKPPSSALAWQTEQRGNHTVLHSLQSKAVTQLKKKKNKCRM